MTALALRSTLPRTASLALAGSLAVAVSAQIQMPSWPVPMTLQTYAVLTVGALLGPRVGAAALLVYLVEGAAGLPVFAGGASSAALAGPTAGYLLGFPLAAFVTGWLASRLTGPFRLPAALLAGGVAIFVPGLVWLGVALRMTHVVALGLTPFIPGDLAKMALAAVTVCALERRR